MDEIEERSPKTEAEREQTKLRATYLNGIAIGIFLVGGLSVPSSILLSPAAGGSIAIPLAIALFCFIVSPALHWTARISLKELDR
ncbi:amino acid transporter [Aureimonas mangrovi]|uniref:amino acid transporter n=1 Tax=Aureimonas mangrovi TaxID=2758041 RepID=UPI00163DD922|nr:amino acid transporter [Aureimonas mangrovi]